MKKFKSFIFFILAFSIISCSQNESSRPNKGEIVIAADESFRNVTEALAERYVAHYPETKLHLKFQKEDYALMDLLKQNVRVIVMSRELTDKEKELYKQMVDLPLKPAKFAGDAAVFIVAKNSPRNSISIEDIKKELQSDEKNIIFDGVNASNFNFVAQKLNLPPQKIKYSLIKGNKGIVEQINKFPNSIGVISLNTISNPYSLEAKNLREQIKILPITVNNTSYLPDLENIRNMKYPFTRILYFLTNEGHFGLGNGFIRFSCTQKGQIVVSKEGLQPYNIFKREVMMR
ncbi:PstS family phosphate ABC transporter substrate-binding protein [Cloacibacterium sp. TD35]|uniref:PstS family phosphate ABC transporter substrate-binding protein n=1 Tax=Cloacibacterium sp. TD35 TaxID=2976818 RepID=UPI00237E861A|nr:substrate-binding domain-containing protein [Cloacibacterium sp. TD35]WDT68973.1 substrate-binding domain-containing protein [Cloacibacterium sp. TD35]